MATLPTPQWHTERASKRKIKKRENIHYTDGEADGAQERGKEEEEKRKERKQERVIKCYLLLIIVTVCFAEGMPVCRCCSSALGAIKISAEINATFRLNTESLM